MRHRPLILLFAVAALMCGPVVALAPQARAHNSLIGSVPSAGETVTAPPTQVKLGFVDPPSVDATFAVKSPSGQRVDVSRATQPQPVEGYTVTLGLAPLSETGSYTVEYSTVSLDGAPLSGTFTFTYAQASQAPDGTGPSEAPDGTGSGGAPASTGSVTALGDQPLLTVLLPAPLLLLGAMFVLVSRRRASSMPVVDGPAEPASCRACGRTVTPDQNFCVQCGAPLD